MNTLFDKIWDQHVVQQVADGPTQLYIDRLYCHEVTSPQAFDGLRARGLKCFRPEKIYCMPDHNTPTHDQDQPIVDPVSKQQVDTLERNAREFGLTHYGMGTRDNGIIHVVGPEKGLSLPGMTIVCGDSHTSTHGAMGAVAFGIGTSEVEMVMASQCILQQKPKSMRINVNGKLKKGVTAKDVALYLMAQLTTSGATGYFVEYAGDVITTMSMEGRLTLCNLSIEMGARGGFIAPDDVTFNYIKGREFAPKGEAWDKAVAYWRTLRSGNDAVFDKELTFNAEDIEPRITYGTNPGMGIGITERIPDPSNLPCLGEATNTPPKQGETEGVLRSLKYMGFTPNQQLLGTKVDYVFLGACTNGRIEDFRAFASIVKGRKKADDVVAWLVPGSWAVRQQIEDEGLDKVLAEAGFEIRQPGCSACLAMNDDKVPQKFNVITSTCVPLPIENVDNDQIIPARFPKATTREERFFGDNLFRDWRYRADGTVVEDFVLNNPQYSGCILVAGKNFGSGSSREHAAWAIAGYGFRVVISSFFADIHKNNELNNFVLPVQVSEPFLQELFATIQSDPKAEVRVDLPNQTVTNLATGHSEHFDINGYKKHCLMNGLDDIDFLMQNQDKTEQWEHGNKVC